MLFDPALFANGLSDIGWRPVLSGSAVLIVAIIAGWGIAADAHLAPVRWIGRWVDRVIVPVLRSGWLVRALGIFVNNTVVCGLIIAAGALPGGSWASITMVGLSMGFAIRHLGAQPPQTSPEKAQSPTIDSWTTVGLMMNLLEVPAIGLAVGLSIGQVASQPHFSLQFAWAVYGQLIVPVLLIAACGESTWIGRVHPFDAQRPA